MREGGSKYALCFHDSREHMNEGFNKQEDNNPGIMMCENGVSLFAAL